MKEHDLDMTRWWDEGSNITKPPERRIAYKSMKELNGEENDNIFQNWIWKSILTKKGWTALLEKSTTKRISLMWAYGKHLKIKRWQPTTNGKQFDWIGINKEMKNLFHREDNWRTWVICYHPNRTILRESF